MCVRIEREIGVGKYGAPESFDVELRAARDERLSWIKKWIKEVPPPSLPWAALLAARKGGRVG